MTAYAFWNNKGGVGKSYLSFIAACEYAHRNPHVDVYVLDLCPQGNVSEILLGADGLSDKLDKLISGNIRNTVGGYAESRLNSPFLAIDNMDDYIINVSKYNANVPENVSLAAGDYLLEILSEAMRQAAQLSVPMDAWRKVISWIRDLIIYLRQKSAPREALFILDCNPSFAIYTQMALAAAESLIVPFTADDSSRRAIENVLALVYGVGEAKTAAYARISFQSRMADQGMQLPKLHTFISNRVTRYEGQPSRAFKLANSRVKQTVDAIYTKNPHVFANRQIKPSLDFVDVPDYHSAAIVSALTGTPIHALKAGPKKIGEERIQINSNPLKNYKSALAKFVDRL